MVTTGWSGKDDELRTEAVSPEVAKEPVITLELVGSIQTGS